ncbi:MAG TPA: plastocyanin/azurin family copper-binding protein [Oscillatoriaceae cyanobacterium]
MFRSCALVLACLAAMPAIALAAPTPILDQTQNLTRPDVAPTGELDFRFTHRFSVPGGKVTNSPTFDLSTGLLPPLDASLRYATNSDVNDQFNEWELALKYRLSPEDAPWHLALVGAYNTAAISGDGALVAAYDLGPLTLLANGKAFTSGYGVGGTTTALGAGAVWHLNRFVALSADYGSVVSARNLSAIAAQTGGLMPAWSAAVQFAIPDSPHVLSLYLTNANTRTLEGASRGTAQLRAGFEFLIPFHSLAPWGELFQPPTLQNGQTPAESARQTHVTINQFLFNPNELTVPVGTTVVWTNYDTVRHSVTSDGGMWDSGLLSTGQTFRYTFNRAGDYAYHCTPHPFMRGVIHVR